MAERESHGDAESHYDNPGVADRYACMFTGQRPTAAQYARFYRFVTLLPQGGVVLDAGCGTGRFEPAFLERGFRVVGVDSSQAMLDKAKELLPECEFLRMDVRRLEFADGTFDGVWSVAVVLHLSTEDLVPCLREARRVLKPDGVLHVATRTAEQDRIAIEQATEGGEMVIHYHARGSLVEALRSTGFDLFQVLQEPDDLGRPFDYLYLYARASSGRL